MPEARRPALDEVLAPGSYSFVVLEAAFRDERDLPGLLRYKLEGILPRGLEGLRFFFRRIGRTRRFLVTLVKESAPESFVPARTVLPFALELPEKGACTVKWISHNAAFIVRYDDGLLSSVEAAAKADGSMTVATSGSREAPKTGPTVQQPFGGSDLVWKISSAALGLALAAQVAFIAANAIASRESRLASLNEQIAVLSKFADSGSNAVATAPDTGLQTRADEIQRSVSRRWIPGYYLEMWSLKAGVLRLEGWGPDALSLLASLRSDPALAKLELASRKGESGYDSFAFEEKVGDD